MKAKDFRWPYTWEERRPLIFDRVLCVPEYYDKHGEWTFPGWEDPSLFGNQNPVHIEYCSGNGDWIAAKAQANPQQNWVAVEIQFERVRKIWAKVKKSNLPNLFIVFGNAFPFTQYYLPANSVDSIYINFPDPWPKNKHAKNRILQNPFVADLARVVKKGGSATFATDDPPYSEQMSTEMLKHEAWQAVFPKPYYVTQWPNYGTSYFEQLWLQKGKGIRYLQFENRKNA
jgi:tRNA (guanine-N7-)-methyltransferase